MTAQPLSTAAAELGVSRSTLERWIACGAPVARHGGRGRGRQTLVDVGAIRAWRRQGDDSRADYAREIAGKLPELVGDAVAQAFQLAPDKRGAAWVAVCAWQLVTGALLDSLRADAPDLRDPNAVPEAVERIRKCITE